MDDLIDLHKTMNFIVLVFGFFGISIIVIVGGIVLQREKKAEEKTTDDCHMMCQSRGATYYEDNYNGKGEVNLCKCMEKIGTINSYLV